MSQNADQHPDLPAEPLGFDIADPAVPVVPLEEPSPKSPAERAGFPDWLVTYGWILVAFVIFQVVAAVVIVVGLAFKPGADFSSISDPAFFAENYDLMFLGNSMGQIFAFGLLTLPVIYFVRHRSMSEMLPFRRGSSVGRITAMAAVGVLVAQPAIWLLSWLNLQIPMPDFLAELERQQNDLIEGFLKSDFNLALALFHVAMVPAVCEEILYRGFVLNMLRRTKAIWTAILISGIIFGLYHLRLSQVVPLALIGIFLGWITVRSGSLIPAMVAHLINNSFSVIVVRLAPDSPLASSEPSMPPIWLALVSIALVYGVLYGIRTITPEEGDSHV